MTALEQFNALNGTKAYRKDLENILQKAKDENNASLVYRISKTLNAFPDVNSFEIEIISYPEAPQGLSGAQHSGNYKEALDDCGRLRKGWKFVKGNVVKIQKKEKPKKESKPKKETGPVKSKEENNSKKETKKDKKYKFVVITDNRPNRVIAVFSYTNPNIKDLRESFWKNGEGKYYETTEEGLRRYTFGMGVYPFEEAKKHIEEKYTEGKDFIYFIIETDGGRDEAISLVEKPKKETDKTAIDEIKKIVQERLKNQGKPRLYEVLHLESAKGIFIFSWSDLGNIDGTKKKENALAKGLYQYTFPKFKTTQEKIEFSNQVWYDLLINKSLTLKRDVKEPTLNIINYYLGKNTIEDIERVSKKTTEETKPKKGKTPKKETGPVKAKEKKDKKTTEEIKKEDDLEQTEGRKALVNRAMYYTRIRKKGRSYDEMYKNAKDLGEKHIDLIFNLSYLNPKGLMISDFIYDNVNKEECLKMVNWTGEARRLYPDLDNKYEDFFRDLRFQDFYKKETKEFFFKGIVDWHTKRTKRAAFLKSILDKYNIVLDYHSFNRFLIGINNNLYKNNYKELPDRDFYDFFFYLTDKLNNEFINDLKKHFVNTIEGKKIKKNAVDEEYLYKGELHQKGIEILRVVLKELEEAKGLSGVDYSQALFDDIGLNAPRHEGILKEALTEKGKLKKGWYFQDYGIFDPKGKYHPLEREFAYEYKIASDELRSRAFKQDEKNKQKGFEENVKIQENLKEFFKSLSQKNRKYFKSYKAVEIFYWAFNFGEKPTNFFTIEETNPYNQIQLKVFDKYFSNKNELFTRLENYETLRRYNLTDLGLKIITEIGSFLNKEGKKVRGDVKKIDKKYGLNAPRHEGILKEALTEKGKLKKGWYFQDYGIIDPKGEYFTLERETPEEYEIIKKVLDDKNSKIKSKINEKIYQKEKQQSADRYSKEQSLYLELYEKNNFSKNLTYDYFVFFLSNGMKGFGINEKYSERSFILNTNSPIQKKYIKTLSENNLVEDIKLVEKKQISGRVHYQYQVFLLSKGISLIKKYIKGYREIYNYDENLKKNKQKYGLSMPFYVQEQEKKEMQPSSNSISNKIKAFQGRNFEIFNIENPDLSTFLGEIERKNIGSNVITLTGGAGSGKTRFAFQFMNALAQNYKVGHASLEEHPESKLYFDKATQYLDSQAQNNISVLENETLDGLENLINENEVIVIDSFAKLREMDSKFLVDKDLRKKYNGKLFLVIFQQTSDGKMRGGSTSEFDGDIILFTKTFDDPKENFVYPSKNRYNALPLSELKYSVFYQQLLHDEEQQEQPVTDLIFDVVY